MFARKQSHRQFITVHEKNGKGQLGTKGCTETTAKDKFITKSQRTFFYFVIVVAGKQLQTSLLHETNSKDISVIVVARKQSQKRVYYTKPNANTFL